MMPRWMPKSIMFHVFFEKGENAPDPLFSHINRGSGYTKSDEITIKICAKSMLEEVMQKLYKMEPKCDPISVQMQNIPEKV